MQLTPSDRMLRLTWSIYSNQSTKNGTSSILFVNLHNRDRLSGVRNLMCPEGYLETGEACKKSFVFCSLTSRPVSRFQKPHSKIMPAFAENQRVEDSLQGLIVSVFLSGSIVLVIRDNQRDMTSACPFI